MTGEPPSTTSKSEISAPGGGVLVWQPLASAVLLSVVIGIVFGIYPAWKASRIDPIQALRS